MTRRSVALPITGVVAAALGLAACGGGTTASGPTTTSHRPTTTTTKPHQKTSTAPPSTAPASTTTTSAPATSATELAPSASLVQKQPKGGGYQVQVPPVWRYANTSIPSDHITNVWTDPATPGQSLTVTGSGCIGCVEHSPTDRTPDPTHVMPPGATVTKQVNAYTTDYQAPTSTTTLPNQPTTTAPTGTTDFGRVLILHQGSVVTGYVRLDAVLPSGDQSLATKMFDSFKLSDAKVTAG